MTISFKLITFLLSASNINQCPEDNGNEVAFIGYSNAGKSSAINAITNVKNLARTSKTPGRTQLINFFGLDANNRLVDLPGYGYAKVAKNISCHFSQLINNYLETRESLRGIVLIMDIRHPLKKLDMDLIQWAIECNLPLHILLTKADKLTRNEATKTLRLVEKHLMIFNSSLITVQIFSSLNHTGLNEVKDKITDLLYPYENRKI